MIEAETYRMGAHTTADDPTKYRQRTEEEQWGHLDPLERLETYLRDSHRVGSEFFDSVVTEAQEMADQLRAEVLAMDPPTFEESFDNAYAEPHSLVSAERAEFLAYQAGFAPQDASEDSGSEGARA